MKGVKRELKVSKSIMGFEPHGVQIPKAIQEPSQLYILVSNYRSSLIRNILSRFRTVDLKTAIELKKGGRSAEKEI